MRDNPPKIKDLPVEDATFLALLWNMHELTEDAQGAERLSKVLETAERIAYGVSAHKS